MHTGESTAEIEREAGSNDVTESAYPLHDNTITGMFGFCDDMCSTLICLCNVQRVEKLSADSALGFWQQSLYHAHSASMGNWGGLMANLNKMLSYRRETALQGALYFSPKAEY